MKLIDSCVLAGLLLSGCGGGGGASESQRAGGPPPAESSTATFAFQTVDEVELRVFVTRDGVPLARAHVSVVDELVPPTNGDPLEDVTKGGSYYQGYTDDEGRIRSPVPIPLRVQVVDVIVDAHGSIGSYAHESLRETWGPFSPSARIRAPVSALGQLEVRLTRE